MRRDCAPCCCTLIEVEWSAKDFMVVAMILRSCKCTSDQKLRRAGEIPLSVVAYHATVCCASSVCPVLYT